jgi:hypothetical protein
MVVAVVAAVSECVYARAFCDACNDDASRKKAMADAVAVVAYAATVLLVLLMP